MSVTHTSDAAGPATDAYSLWGGRLRLLAAIALIWAGLHFVVERTVLPAGLHRPVLIVATGGGLLGPLAVAVILWLGAYVGTLLAGPRDEHRTLFAVGMALALWTVGNGTMDDWLKFTNELAAGPRSAAYWPLLAEYVFLGVVIAGAVAAGSLAAHGRTGPRRAFALEPSTTHWRDGVKALLTTTAIAAVLLLILTGPRAAQTARGQVFFAVTVAFVLGVMAARRLTHVRRPLWYFPAPILVGLAGVFLAGFSPALPLPFENLDTIPAWGLVRPLPVEMVGVGLAAIAWTLHTTDRLSGEEDTS